MDRTIHVALSCEVHNRIRSEFLEQSSHLYAIGNITLNEFVSRISGNTFQIVQVPGIRELIHIEHGYRTFRHYLQHEVRSDESRTASDKNAIVHVNVPD